MSLICAYCKIAKNLIKSHIISDFLYRRAGFRESDHSYALNGSETIKVEGNKGSYEPLMCFECEQFRGKFENFFSQQVYQNKKLTFLNDNVDEYFKNIGINEQNKYIEKILGQKDHYRLWGFGYDKVENFFLFTLWMINATNLSEFNGVSLSADLENNIKCLIDSKRNNVSPFRFMFFRNDYLVSLPDGSSFDISSMLRVTRDEFLGYDVVEFCIPYYRVKIFLNYLGGNPDLDPLLMQRCEYKDKKGNFVNGGWTAPVINLTDEIKKKDQDWILEFFRNSI